MKGLPVTIRTARPAAARVPAAREGWPGLIWAKKIGVPADKTPSRVKELHELNPMLGFRGCRLGIVFPEITEMQCRATLKRPATSQKSGVKVEPEIMIPLVGFLPELQGETKIVHETAKKVFAEKVRRKSKYLVGTMIELLRAALVADQIAKEVQVLQLRHERPDANDAGHEPRRQWHVHPPTTRRTTSWPAIRSQTIDHGRRRRPDEDPPSRRAERPGLTSRSASAANTAANRLVKFCHKIGLNYVSAGSFRVPVARLAAVQAALAEVRRYPIGPRSATAAGRTINMGCLVDPQLDTNFLVRLLASELPFVGYAHANRAAGLRYSPAANAEFLAGAGRDAGSTLVLKSAFRRSTA